MLENLLEWLSGRPKLQHNRQSSFVRRGGSKLTHCYASRPAPYSSSSRSSQTLMSPPASSPFAPKSWKSGRELGCLRSCVGNHDAVGGRNTGRNTRRKEEGTQEGTQKGVGEGAESGIAEGAESGIAKGVVEENGGLLHAWAGRARSGTDKLLNGKPQLVSGRSSLAQMNEREVHGVPLKVRCTGPRPPDLA